MTRRTTVWGSRRLYQKGSETVEFGLTLVPMAAFLFLIMDLSWALWVKSTLQHAVRVGVRYAITGQTIPNMGQDASIKAVVQRNAIGILSGSTGADKIFIRYYKPDTLIETASNVGGNLVEISVESYRLVPLAPLLRPAVPFLFTVRASDRVEPSPSGVPPAR